MGEKRKINKNKVFILLSIIFLTFFIALYVTRLVYYYIEENPRKNGEVIKYFSNELTALLTTDASADGIFYDAKTKEYYFKGNPKNNYLQYSGRLWRIISINNDGSIKLITEKSQTLLNNNRDEYITKWLNSTDIQGVVTFKNTLDDVQNYLVNTEDCLDKINDINSVTCDEKKSNNLVSLLSVYEYDRAGNVSSFLNTSEYFWTISQTDENEFWYIFDKGGVNKEEKLEKAFYNIKPVITLKKGIEMLDGEGTIEEPYVILDEHESTLSERLIGEYLSLDSYLWRIIDKTENALKVSMEGYITVDDKEIIKPFSTKKNEINLTDKTGLIYYLNNAFYESLQDKEYLVKGNFNKYIIDFENYDYNLIDSTDTYEAYVGLSSLNNLFISNYTDYYLINNTSESADLHYLINSFGMLYKDDYKSQKRIRPVIFIDNKILALGGNGTKSSPYILGR